MEFRVLGPVEPVDGGRVVPVDAAKQRGLLALLLLSPNRTVPQDELMDRLWHGDPPPSARATLQAYVYRLRRTLAGAGGTEVLHGRPGGYLLEVPSGAIDSAAFEASVAAGRRALGAGRFDEAAAAFREGLALWRGTAFDGIDLAAVRDRARELEELRVEAVEECLTAELGAGRHTAAVTELEALVRAHPLRERLWELLLLALFRCGRQAEALAAYQRLYRLLDEELGVEPTPRVQELQQRILAGDPALAAGDAERVPRQLPAATEQFTGRAGPLAELDRLLLGGDRAPGTVRSAVITGTAGVGKTTLAVHWAHRAADRFPDGQLYVNLRGFDPAGRPTSPATAVRGFLDAFGVPPERVPEDLEAQSALYRSLLAGKRMLVVLDNARDADQVRPLLPGAEGCAVVVTSRSQLPGLVAGEGARPVVLGLPSADEAHLMLRKRIGADRTAAEPEAAAGIVAACARLPLALALVAARAAVHPDFRLADLAAELRDSRSAFDAIASPDPAGDVRAVLSWSYRAVTPEAAKLFRTLGLHPGPDVSVAAAAAQLGRPPREVRPLLAELAHANLVAEHRPGRYALHDLLHVYAAELAEHHDSGADRREAARRLLDHYLHTAHAAALLVDPGLPGPAVPLAEPAPGVAPEALADRASAMAWFEDEHRAMAAAAARAAGDFDVQVYQSAWWPQRFFFLRGYWHDLIATQLTALAAAERLDDPGAQAQAHRALARADGRLRRFAESRAHLERSLELSALAGDPSAQAATHNNLGNLAQLQGRHREALEHSRRALDLYRGLGHRFGEAHALNSIGWQLAVLGEHAEARDRCGEALDLFLEIGYRYGEAATSDSLGYIHARLGLESEALKCYLRAREIFRDLGDRFEEADTLSRLGDLYRSIDDPAAAQDAWSRALALLDDLDHPDADGVRAKLREAAAG